ncbi:MAG: hypothetical protein WAT78_11620 [Rhizobiaceae bacterium]
MGGIVSVPESEHSVTLEFAGLHEMVIAGRDPLAKMQPDPDVPDA